MQHQWEPLSCECGSMHFVEKVELRWKPDGGMVKRPQGYVCVKCGEAADGQKLIQKKQREHKEKELEELKAQIG